MAQHALELRMAAEPKPSYDVRWVTLITGMVVLGLVMAFSASYPKASAMTSDSVPGDALKYFKLHLMFVCIGLAGMIWASRVRPAMMQRYSGLGLLVCLGLMFATLVIGMVTGEKTRGAILFIDIGPIRFQPSEFAKIFFIAFLAAKLSLGPLDGKTLKRVGYPIAWATALYCGILLLQSDQGMMVLVFLIALAMSYLGGLSLGRLGTILGGAGVLATLAAVTDAERLERIRAWIDPLKYQDSSGRHILSMLVASARGWIGGLGLGMSPDKWGQMPEAHTDSIFCVMAGELGLLVMGGFLVLIGAIVMRCFQTAKWSSDSFGYFLASGIGIMLGTQALINMFVATNMMPVTGLTLPYISYGGSSLITCLTAAGMVMSVYRHGKRGEGA
ncbi:MAG: FtsW/RodA/SpoVE family cell cycle protein [Armatimonadia bacterium]